MADKKVSALTAATTTASTDLAHVITSVATTPTNEKVTLANVFNKSPSFYGFSGTGIQAYTSASSALTADWRSCTCYYAQALLQVQNSQMEWPDKEQ